MSVTYDCADGVALIQMNDGKANALSHTMLEALEGAFDKVESDDEAKSVVLAGREGLFCGGFDTKVILGGTPDEARELFIRGGKMLDRMISYPRPFVVAATGHAVAMGAFFLLAADYRIGAEGSFRIGLNESAAGIDIPYNGIPLTQERLSPNYLTRSVVLAELFDPKLAVEAGFLDKTAAPDRVLAEARGTAALLAALVPSAFKANKLALRRKMLHRIEAGL